MKTPRLIRPSFFLWIVVPALMFGTYQLYGLPHVIWSYEWRPTGPNSYANYSARHYTRCTYLGPYGAITEYPTDGTCGWLRFAHKAEVR